MSEQATKQAPKVSPVSGVAPPVERQFGQPNGNPRHNGAWKKESTPRFKLEKMMELSEAELRTIAEDAMSPLFERKLAIAIRKGVWKEIESMINQVYGAPKQTIEQTNIEAPKPLFDRSKDAKHDNPGKDTKVKKAS